MVQVCWSQIVNLLLSLGREFSSRRSQGSDFATPQPGGWAVRANGGGRLAGPQATVVRTPRWSGCSRLLNNGGVVWSAGGGSGV
ncbi:hypothetical protein LWI28_002956 [Acer negundo]|uniref:Uncharacterized protein n=1 Tax=Acer negundo TaxID=4023 RepID=A0AAD5IQL8_ACENE|nr:hypothetical protein LWI28_002956 [Acer negundo]